MGRHWRLLAAATLRVRCSAAAARAGIRSRTLSGCASRSASDEPRTVLAPVIRCGCAQGRGVVLVEAIRSFSDAVELKDHVLVEALVIGRCDLAHGRVEAVMRHVGVGALGGARKGVAEAILAAALPASRRTEHRDDKVRRRTRVEVGRSDEQRLGRRVAQRGDALAKSVREEEGELRQCERVGEARRVAARPQRHRVEVAKVLVLTANKHSVANGDLTERASERDNGVLA